MQGDISWSTETSQSSRIFKKGDKLSFKKI